MKTIEIQLLDATRCRATHPQTGATLDTDISKEYGGGGAGFSSTDLVAVGLATCIGSSLSPIAIREAIPLEGIQISVAKELTTKPKRLSRIAVEVNLPPGLTPAQEKKLAHAARTCTVHRSLAPAIDLKIVVQSPD